MAKMASGTRKRADGNLEKRITIDGKRYSIYGKTQKEVLEKEVQLRADIANGINIDKKNITLDTYFEKFFIPAKEQTVKAITIFSYSKLYNAHIKAALGKRKVQQIERQEIVLLQKELSENYKAKTVNMVITLLVQILQEAVKDDITIKNTGAGIKNITEKKEKASETYHRALTQEEQKAFMAELKDSDNYYYEFIALLLCTGMRQGEAAALTWDDIDSKNNVIHVTKTVTKDKDGKNIVGESPKTAASRRDIPMSATVKNVLLSQKKKQKLVSISNKLVFPGLYKNSIIDDLQINNAIKETCKSMNDKGSSIEHFTAHALRDTFATRYIEQGGTPQTLKTILGHSSLAMTMDLYAHVLPNTKQEEMDRISIII